MTAKFLSIFFAIAWMRKLDININYNVFGQAVRSINSNATLELVLTGKFTHNHIIHTI